MPATNVQPATAPHATVRLPLSLWRQLSRLAKRNKRSRNTEIWAALTAHVKDHAK